MRHNRLGVAVPAQLQVMAVTKTFGLDKITAAGDPALHGTAIPSARRI
jgi:hypothetical protein